MHVSTRTEQCHTDAHSKFNELLDVCKLKYDAVSTLWLQMTSTAQDGSAHVWHILVLFAYSEKESIVTYANVLNGKCEALNTIDIAFKSDLDL